jgi:hemophore-related protein
MMETPERAQANLRAYFVSHPQQYNDLRVIAQPLTDLRTTCNRNVSAAQVAALLQAFAAPS